MAAALNAVRTQSAPKFRVPRVKFKYPKVAARMLAVYFRGIPIICALLSLFIHILHVLDVLSWVEIAFDCSIKTLSRLLIGWKRSDGELLNFITVNVSGQKMVN